MLMLDVAQALPLFVRRRTRNGKMAVRKATSGFVGTGTIRPRDLINASRATIEGLVVLEFVLELGSLARLNLTLFHLEHSIVASSRCSRQTY